MGAAYLAEHEALAHIKCVIKLVLAELARHPMAISRYKTETERLYRVMDKRLKTSPYLAGKKYSIADMASYPWINPERQGQDIDDFPNLKRWKAAIRARPATGRAYARAKEVNPNAGGIRTEQERKILFGQDKSVVK